MSRVQDLIEEDNDVKLKMYRNPSFNIEQIQNAVWRFYLDNLSRLQSERRTACSALSAVAVAAMYVVGIGRRLWQHGRNATGSLTFGQYPFRTAKLVLH